ncbi:MAG TPA: alpha-ribazole phosphatase [Anaerolineales bacterium]|nr:alpha-ribazole phosphatase [Anaerolineales bacterium]
MTRLILIRHGETDWNTTGRWQGQTDVPLNERGRQQARQLVADLAGMQIDAIYSSDLGRARDTAAPLSQAAGLPVIVDSRLREIHQGEWQGQLFDEIEARYAEALRSRREDPLNLAPPGGETVAQVRARVLRCLEQILKRHPDESVVIVSHGFVLGLLRAHLLGEPVGMAWERIPQNGGWEVVEVDGLGNSSEFSRFADE